MSDTKLQPNVPREKGIIYVATGRKFLEEAFQSIASVKAVMPHLPITLFTDQTDVKNHHLDSVLPLVSPSFSFADKIQPMIDSPYEKTLYLDTDIYMAESVENLFLMLEKYDVLGVQDPWRNDYPFEKVPDCFPTINTGVIAFRKTPEVQEFLKTWSKNYWESFVQKQKNDQPAFRHTLFHSNVKLFVLPPEFNMRSYHPCFIGGHTRVKIFHERNRALPKIARVVNKGYRPRVYGQISPRLTMFYYFQKTIKVTRRLAQKLFLGQNK